MQPDEKRKLLTLAMHTDLPITKAWHVFREATDKMKELNRTADIYTIWQAELAAIVAILEAYGVKVTVDDTPTTES